MKRTKEISPLERSKKFLKQQWPHVGLIGLVLVVGLNVIPRNVNADVAHPTEMEKKATALMVTAMTNTLVEYGSFPASALRLTPRKVIVTTTAYSSDIFQTDSTPFVTASGTTVRPGVVAANFLPIGTTIKIPALYGDQIFVVEDRMNKRYDRRLDIWMGSREEAKRFGVKKLEVEIYE